MTRCVCSRRSARKRLVIQQRSSCWLRLKSAAIKPIKRVRPSPPLFAANPNDLTLLAMKMRFDGKSQEAIDAEMEKRGAASPDRNAAFAQEMAEALRARQQGDLASVDHDLAIAQKLKPDDPHIWDALFLRSIETANWDKAEGYVEQLASNNVDLAGGVLYRIRLATAQNDLNKALEIGAETDAGQAGIFAELVCARRRSTISRKVR